MMELSKTGIKYVKRWVKTVKDKRNVFSLGNYGNYLVIIMYP